MAPREVGVVSLALVGCRAEPPELTLAMTVTKGYYVRSLARDLAARLGTAGHLTQLRRTRSGCFTIEEAIALDRIRRGAARPPGTAHARGDAGARGRAADGDGSADARFGRVIAPGDLETASAPNVPCAWIDAREALVAVGQVDDAGWGHVIRGFVEEGATR